MWELDGDDVGLIVLVDVTAAQLSWQLATARGFLERLLMAAALCQLEAEEDSEECDDEDKAECNGDDEKKKSTILLWVLQQRLVGVRLAGQDQPGLKLQQKESYFSQIVVNLISWGNKLLLTTT